MSQRNKKIVKVKQTCIRGWRGWSPSLRVEREL